MDKCYFSYDNNIKYLNYGYSHCDYIIVDGNILPKYVALEHNKPLGLQSNVIFKEEPVFFNLVWDIVYGEMFKTLTELPMYKTMVFYDAMFRTSINIQVVGINYEYIRTLNNLLKLYKVILTIRVIN